MIYNMMCLIGVEAWFLSGKWRLINKYTLSLQVIVTLVVENVKGFIDQTLNSILIMRVFLDISLSLALETIQRKKHVN